MKNKNIKLPQSFQLFGQVWKKLFHSGSCVPDVSLDYVLTSMVSIAAETMVDDMPLIEKWILSYIDIVNASGNDVERDWLISSWVGIVVPGRSIYVDGSGKDGKKYIVKSDKELDKDIAKDSRNRIIAISEMEKTIKKLLKSKQLVLVDGKLRLS